MSKRLRYRVDYGTHKAAFSHADEAQLFAQYMAQTRRQYVEVSCTSGLIGQYDRNGMPTEEFRGRGDEVYPAGPCVQRTA